MIERLYMYMYNEISKTPNMQLEASQMLIVLIEKEGGEKPKKCQIEEQIRRKIRKK